MSPTDHDMAWRRQEFVTQSTAAAILGVSPTWIYDALVTGALEARRLKPGGRPMITVSSLKELIDRARPVVLAELRKPRAAAELRLIVSNA